MQSPDQQRCSSPLAAAQADRRRHPRYSVQVQLELRLENSDVPMRLETTDLSRHGCYIVLTTPLMVGMKVRARLRLGDCAVLVGGRVVTRHPQFGNGIMFLEYEGDGEEKLKEYLDAINSE